MGYLATSLSWKCNRCGDIHTGKTSLYECEDCGATLCEHQLAEFNSFQDGRYHWLIVSLEYIDDGGETKRRLRHKYPGEDRRCEAMQCGPVKLKIRQVQCGSVADAIEAEA